MWVEGGARAELLVAGFDRSPGPLWSAVATAGAGFSF
jgi:hypothetical protein